MAEKIKVTTGKLRKKQEEWLKDFEKAEECFFEINDLLNKLGQFFGGKPVEKIREMGLKKQEEGRTVLSQLKKHIEKIEAIAAVYDQAERSSISVSTDD